MIKKSNYSKDTEFHLIHSIQIIIKLLRKIHNIQQFYNHHPFHQEKINLMSVTVLNFNNLLLQKFQVRTYYLMLRKIPIKIFLHPLLKVLYLRNI